MRRIMIEVDCGKKRCKGCQFLEELPPSAFARYECTAFDVVIAFDKHGAERCSQCLSADTAAYIELVLAGVPGKEVSP